MNHPPHPPFRADINGLRALAVLAVLLYHFGVLGFTGGYVGVDVFFVISGFLMTQILCAGLDTGTLSLRGFYAARVRRILPALLVLVAVLLIIGYRLMTPADYKWLGRATAATVTFTANLFFSHKGDYFDPAIRESWLLHTWSLAVEGQFYLLYPLYVIWLRKFHGGRFFTTGLSALLVPSLLVSVLGTAYDPSAAFFILPTRIWEFMAGGLAFLVGDRLTNKAWVAAIGVGLIAVAITGFDDGMEFPGWRAVIPVLGAALIIAAKTNPRWVSSGLVQFFGSRSYSLYLWHWPVLRAAEYMDLAVTPQRTVLLFVCAVVLATASYGLVETPFRRRKKRMPEPFFLGAGLTICGVLYLAGHHLDTHDGLPSRVPDAVAAAALEADNSNPRLKICMTNYKKGRALPECLLGDVQVVPSVAVWGDSHAGALFTAMDDTLRAAHRAGIFYGSNSCPPILGGIFTHKSKSLACKLVNQANYEHVIRNVHVKDVLLISRWPAWILGYNEKAGAHQPPPYLVFDEDAVASEKNLPQRARAYGDNIVKTLCALHKEGKNVYVLKTVPEMIKNVPDTLAKARLVHHQEISVTVSQAAHEQRNLIPDQAFSQAATMCGVRILDPTPVLCRDGRCAGIRDGRPLYLDDNHLSDSGSRLLRPLLSAAFGRQQEVPH